MKNCTQIKFILLRINLINIFIYNHCTQVNNWVLITLSQFDFLYTILISQYKISTILHTCVQTFISVLPGRISLHFITRRNSQNINLRIIWIVAETLNCLTSMFLLFYFILFHLISFILFCLIFFYFHFTLFYNSIHHNSKQIRIYAI